MTSKSGVIIQLLCDLEKYFKVAHHQIWLIMYGDASLGGWSSLG